MKSQIIGIYGHRSWIGQALLDRIQETTDFCTTMIDKRDWDWPTRSYRCLFIIPGKLEQTNEEMAEERRFVAAVAANPGSCPRQVLLGSQSVFERDTPYGVHKHMVEQAFFGAHELRWRDDPGTTPLVVRPGAVFGPTQPIGSKMLIPSLAREGDRLELRDPDRPTKFISIDDLVTHMVGLIDETPQWWGGAEIPGTLVATPRQMKSLWRTFSHLRAAAQPDE